MPIAPVLRSRRRAALHAVAAGCACIVLPGCGGGPSSGGSAAPPESRSQIQPAGSGPGSVPAEDVAEVKQAMQAIRACRPGGSSGSALHTAVTTVVGVYDEVGPEAHYESNDTLTPTNMRDVATQARAALQRCRATAEVRRLDAVLGAS
jgi:hypothetical protein